MTTTSTYELNKEIFMLLRCFPGSIINDNGEFIAHIKTNQYFRLEDCTSKLDIQCKVLEWLSKAACEMEPYPYSSDKKNEEFQDFMLKGINAFLGTTFSKTDMKTIYSHLGNGINHNKTILFIEMDYDISVLSKCNDLDVFAKLIYDKASAKSIWDSYMGETTDILKLDDLEEIIKNVLKQLKNKDNSFDRDILVQEEREDISYEVR